MFRPNKTLAVAEFVSDAFDCSDAIVLQNFEGSFPLVEMLFAVDAHLRVDVPLPLPYLKVISILCASDTPIRRSCPMAQIVAELMLGKQLLGEALPVCAAENFIAYRVLEGPRGEKDLLRFCDGMVSRIEARWERARSLMAAAATRIATVSDQRLWKLWPIDAAASAFVRNTHFLP